MKAKFLTLILLLIGVNAMAGGIKVKSGNSSFVKEQVSAQIVMDFSNARWEKDDDFKEWSGADYEARVEAAMSNFISAFNEKSKGLTVKRDNGGVKYCINFKIENLERHQSFTSTWGRGEVYVTGVIEVVDYETKERVCVIQMTKCGSGADYNTTDGIGKCFKGLGEDIAKLK